MCVRVCVKIVASPRCEVPVCERAKCVMGCVMVPQSVCHTERATASVLIGASGSGGAT